MTVILSEGRVICLGRRARTIRRTPRRSEATMQHQGVLTKFLALGLIAALASLFTRSSPAADDPAKALQVQFEAAKTSLAAGDLASAESHYIDTIALGLRQLAQLALSMGQIDEAASYLDSALNLKPG